MLTADLIRGNTPLILGAIIALSAFAVYRKWDRRLSTIPGPKGNPVTGIGTTLPPNAPDVFRQWALEYGELFKIRVGWYNWVVVNTPEAMKAIFDKASASTSSKPPMPLGDGVVVAGRRMFTMPYSAKWRIFRKAVQELLSPKMTMTFMPTQEFEVKQLMWELANSNSDQSEFYNHIRRLSFSIVSTSTYGRRIDTWDHEDVKYAAESQKLLGQISKPGAFIADEIPPLAELPHFMQPGRRRAERFAGPVLGAKTRIFYRLKDEVNQGKAPTCFGKELLESDYKKQGLEDEDAAWILGGLVEAGSETSAVTLQNLVLFLAANPQVQERANEELTKVVGENRAPTFDDTPNLPFIHGCVKEVLRMKPVPVWGIKHFADEDIVYKGQVIPKGTVLLGNTAALHFDPTRFQDPDSFKPERYIEHNKSSADYAAMGDPYQRDHYTFGAGRRICPGSRLAENTLNLAVANLLWAFEVRGPSYFDKESGQWKEGTMDLSPGAYTPSAFSPPKPFKARFLPRSTERLNVVNENWNKAKQEGYTLRGMTVDVNGIVKN